MKRTEQREHIFKMLFGVEFNAGGDMPEQLELYFGQLEGAGEKDLDYIREKVQKIASKVEEIDALINEHTTRWKTSRMNKVDLTILRLAVYEMRWDEDVPTGAVSYTHLDVYKRQSWGSRILRCR